MSTPNSPWIAQLKADRPHFVLEKDHRADVAIVGAGIAGISTAYQLLRYTDKTVCLIEAGRIAHGATGHNAGIVVNDFERPMKDLIAAFGKDMAIHSEVLVEGAWDILEDMIVHCRLDVPLHQNVSRGGLSTLEQVIDWLDEMHLRAEAGIHDQPLLLRIDDDFLQKIPSYLHRYILSVPHSKVLEALHTEDPSFIAATSRRSACMNSALFCQELTAWMVQEYPDRLTIAEHLPLTKLTLKKDHATLETEGPTIVGKHVVLCTNGSENFDIIHEEDRSLDNTFHQNVQGQIAYMVGYTEDSGEAAGSNFYVRTGDVDEEYLYISRRPYAAPNRPEQFLINAGGPIRRVPDRGIYDPTASFPGDIEEEIDRNFRSTYIDVPPPAKKSFLWHGLMGYTPNHVRRIGFEPKNPVLSYNLGCNGIGILPSIYGGKRIRQLLSGEELPPSIFDPEFGDR